MKRSNRTSIALMTGAALCAVVVMFSACSKSNNGPTGPTAPTNPGGYDSANQIQPQALVAYFPFNGSYTDVKGGLTGTNNGATFTTGIKGQAYSGSGTSYVLYANAGAVASLTSFTISAWFKIAAEPVNNPGATYVAGEGANGIFSMYDTKGDDNLLLLELEPYTPVSGDSVRVHAGFDNSGNTAGAGWQGIIPESFLDTAVGKWTQVVATYDGSSSMYTIYENGTAISTSTAWTNGQGQTPTEIYNGPTGGTGTTPMGPINYSPAPSGFVIGAWANTPANAGSPINANLGAQPWAGCLQGALDELRIYNVALSASDVKSLYLLEQAGF